jgi:hypothetical protein
MPGELGDSAPRTATTDQLARFACGVSEPLGADDLEGQLLQVTPAGFRVPLPEKHAGVGRHVVDDRRTGQHVGGAGCFGHARPRA